MKIILRTDVPKLGEKGTVHTVADGFARNYLIPQGMAILATPGELKVVANNQKVADRKILRQEEQLQSLADKISGQKLIFTANTGEQGRLYGSITAADVAEKLSEVVGQEIDRRKVVLDDPIRSLGEHNVTVHLVGKLRPQVSVIVIGEGVEEVAASTEETETADAETADAETSEAEEESTEEV
jgi:large subunit ribosomal protein L9